MRSLPLSFLPARAHLRLAPLVLGAVFAFLYPVPKAQAQFLFDNTKAETAGNADWVIDTGTTRYPTPAASGITASTTETYWTGALSSWGVSLVKTGYKDIQTLPAGAAISYGSTSNAQDLSNYKVYVLDEPNILFTATEKTAIISFVQNGGSLLMVSDHGGSDRNNDGKDSVQVWNDLFTNNGVKNNPFGMKFNGDDISPQSTFIDASASDPITHGASGAVTQFNYNNGSTITIDTSANLSVKAAVWSSSAHSSSLVMAAYATYGSGRVVAIGDSSPLDDGTGDAGHTLFDGWDANSDGTLALNASQWLAAASPSPAPEPNGIAAILIGMGVLGLVAARRSLKAA